MKLTVITAETGQGMNSREIKMRQMRSKDAVPIEKKCQFEERDPDSYSPYDPKRPQGMEHLTDSSSTFKISLIAVCKK
ncbi:hypothetical protein JRQ81_006596 [Phrynocephalus forsythii]|uniref:Uncharacterized protein n=1 Tax=Phrynocephalus forsythii TaxID=171643 RepID=A0A9Q0Y3K2_9SAUR|nr:hypothetical protein JRQ81_006596 [Phrynocephalus forsythii]